MLIPAIQPTLARKCTGHSTAWKRAAVLFNYSPLHSPQSQPQTLERQSLQADSTVEMDCMIASHVKGMAWHQRVTWFGETSKNIINILKASIRESRARIGRGIYHVNATSLLVQRDVIG